MRKKKVVVVSGYFNPIHIGHLHLFKEAKALGDYLIVIVDNDHQVRLKGAIPFLPEKDRVEIVKAIKWVDDAFLSIDSDGSVSQSLRRIKPDIFANGGDRSKDGVPVPKSEEVVCRDLNIKMIYNVGGKKLRSSSELLKSIKNKK